MRLASVAARAASRRWPLRAAEEKTFGVRANRLVFASQKFVGTLAIPGYQEVLEADIAPLWISGARL
ncbi:MAG TPA: hypothetical protein VMQ51_20360, partial [Candidatus Binatia bacterium]|nr:hypothetical protein [Candidatus Binatia bacterium]